MSEAAADARAAMEAALGALDGVTLVEPSRAGIAKAALNLLGPVALLDDQLPYNGSGSVAGNLPPGYRVARRDEIWDRRFFSNRTHAWPVECKGFPDIVFMLERSADGHYAVIAPARDMPKDDVAESHQVLSAMFGGGAFGMAPVSVDLWLLHAIPAPEWLTLNVTGKTPDGDRVDIDCWATAWLEATVKSWRLALVGRSREPR